MAAARVILKFDEVIRPIVSVRVVNPSNNKSKIVLALLDTGSDRDIVAKNVSEELDMNTWTETLTVKTLDCYTSGDQFTRGCVDALPPLQIHFYDGYCQLLPSNSPG